MERIDYCVERKDFFTERKQFELKRNDLEPNDPERNKDGINVETEAEGNQFKLHRNGTSRNKQITHVSTQMGGANKYIRSREEPLTSCRSKMTIQI